MAQEEEPDTILLVMLPVYALNFIRPAVVTPTDQLSRSRPIPVQIDTRWHRESLAPTTKRSHCPICVGDDQISAEILEND